MKGVFSYQNPAYTAPASIAMSEEFLEFCHDQHIPKVQGAFRIMKPNRKSGKHKSRKSKAN